jgi:hypothetical protein
MWFNRAWRIGWTVATLVVVQVVVCAVAAMPAVLVWQWLLALAGPDPIVRLVAVSIALVPSYVVFAMCLVVVSPIAVRGVGWSTPADAEMRIADLEWKLLTWVRYGASIPRSIWHVSSRAPCSAERRFGPRTFV